ncbi:MAG: FAD-dependent oxidoreductase [Kiritimatiellaeota bacterium]|nr:FAD-dependent oxidoreductase [Kiritimatiellota bacterium]
MKLVVVGGVAGGASAAARARRLDEKADITIFERGEYVSFANCGLPYHVGRVIPERESLLIMTPESFRARTGVDVRNLHEVLEINRVEKKVKVKNIVKDEVFEESYDKLILSPGSSPIRPPIPGSDDPDVMVLWTMNDMDSINAAIDAGAKSAVVIGGGFIGVEVAENLRHRNLKTALVEMLPHIMPQMDQEMTVPLHDVMRENGVDLHLNNGVSKITRSRAISDNYDKKGFTVELKDSTKIDADIVIMAIGVRPNTELAVAAGLEIGESKGIKVDEQLRASDPDIFAVGDAIEVRNLVTDAPARIPLAGPANRQGRIAANNAFGASETYKGSLGTAICKIFSLAAASVGLSERALKNAGVDYKKIYINPASHASYYPGSQIMRIKVLFGDDGKILGSQIIGTDGVDKRIDLLAMAMRNGITVSELEELELAYAPPYGSAKDPVNFVGFVGNNLLKGDLRLVYPDAIPADAFVLDVRSTDEYLCGSVPNAVNIPLEELRKRLADIPKDREIAILCKVGVRAYNAERLLRAEGFDAKSISGGYFTWLLFNPTIDSILNDESCWTASEKTSDDSAKLADTPAAIDAAIELNACGLQCPGPVVAVKNKLESMSAGQVLKVTASDQGFKKDIHSWCKSTGNELLSVANDETTVTAFIRKSGAAAAVPAAIGVQAVDAPSRKKTTIVLFSNDLDKSMAGFILATGFASLGHEVNMFFTFWGLNVLRKSPAPSVKKDILSRMFGMMMPCGAKKLALSKMHMMGMGTMMMKHVMNSKNVDSLPMLIKQAQSMGVKFTACEMAMNVMGIQEAELIDGVDTAGVANFAVLAEESGTTLFI